MIQHDRKAVPPWLLHRKLSTQKSNTNSSHSKPGLRGLIAPALSVPEGALVQRSGAIIGGGLIHFAAGLLRGDKDLRA